MAISDWHTSLPVCSINYDCKRFILQVVIDEKLLVETKLTRPWWKLFCGFNFNWGFLSGTSTVKLFTSVINTTVICRLVPWYVPSWRFHPSLIFSSKCEDYLSRAPIVAPLKLLVSPANVRLDCNCLTLTNSIHQH
jgi:hypothetical protein